MWLLCSKGYSCFSQCVEVAPRSRIWDDPNKFFPKMFLTKHANIDASRQHFEFVPFGFGRRSCPSYTFALQVSHLTLTRLLQGFEFTTPLNMPVDMTIGLDIPYPRQLPLKFFSIHALLQNSINDREKYRLCLTRVHVFNKFSRFKSLMT